jgi:alginate O-acetyltransferase complex protein AlgI
MIFTSLSFLLFFPIVILLYFLVPSKFQRVFLLVCSYLFYINLKPIFLLLLLFATLSTYYVTKLISRESSERKKLIYLRVGVFILLAPLFFFKYFPTINSNMISIFSNFSLYWPFKELNYFLPIGISFYTFMAIGYLIDVYQEDVKWESSFISVGLFLSFFPIILSGPIERSYNLLPQFRNLKRFCSRDIVEGLKLILWGYFMKLVVADRLGIYINTVFSNISNHNGNTLAFTSLLYPFQLYADLGGYSLVAIGLAKSLGISIVHNFNYPFFSKSMSELWRRWHISLIQWLTDYLYTPLAFRFRKFNLWGIVLALLITFLISGIWHGANFVFVIWGIIQGGYLSFEALTKKYRTYLINKYNLAKNIFFVLSSIFLTYFLFAFSQIFARPYNVDEAFLVVKKIFKERGPLFIDESSLVYGLLFLFILIFSDFLGEYFRDRYAFFKSKNVYVRFFSYFIIIVFIILFGVLDGGDFIYFKY